MHLQTWPMLRNTSGGRWGGGVITSVALQTRLTSCGKFLPDCVKEKIEGPKKPGHCL